MRLELRGNYNNSFTELKYKNFLDDLNSQLKFPADFRVSETPLFLSDEAVTELELACESIVSQLRTDEYTEYCKKAIPNGINVPNEDTHPVFLQIDFALCYDEEGNILPKLIELQGFPSLYGFQYYLSRTIKKHFPITKDLTNYFSNFDDDSYSKVFKDILLGNSAPENVILLEIEPDKQKTRIDFAATEELTGVKAVCISAIVKKGDKLFYKKDGILVPIERIYNRVIYDELLRKNFSAGFNFTDELDVTWVGHPNWFFKISKYTLTFLKGKNIPNSFFLNELTEYPEDLNNYVLKPLFSFAGLGVEIDLTKERLDLITDRENYILQQKIEYAPLIKTPDDYSKVEIRMMYLWKDEPLLVNNLIRMSKGKMMGVDFNKNKTWVGSSCAFH
jgi:hypothetical protein